jgi:hypothetical protein
MPDWLGFLLLVVVLLAMVSGLYASGSWLRDRFFGLKVDATNKEKPATISYRQSQHSAPPSERPVYVFYHPPPPPPPPPVIPPLKPVVLPPVKPVQPESDIERLTKLRDSCLFKFHPSIKRIPGIVIEPVEHFAKPTNLAHYEPKNNLVCFNRDDLNRSFEDQTDTMIHELLHCYMHQVGPKGSDKTWAEMQQQCHDEFFELAATILDLYFNPAWRTQD